jgi:signal transduction histidine kinase
LVVRAQGQSSIPEIAGAPPELSPGSRAQTSFGLVRELPRLVLFAVGYALAYKYVKFFSSSSPAPLWFPDSVLLCAFLLVPRKRWAWYALIALPIRFMQPDAPPWFLLATYANDCIKAMLSAYLLRRLLPGSLRLNTLRQLGIYIGIAAAFTPALSAIGGAATRFAAGTPFWKSLYQWFMGDATAALVLTPTLLYWCMGEWRELKLRKLQFLALLLGLASVLAFTFFIPHPADVPVLLYAPVPFLILAATTCKPIGTSTAISLVALISMLSTVIGKGPFATSYLHHSVLSMQLFFIVTAPPMLFVAVLIEERRAVERDLKRSRASLRQNYERIHDLAGKLLHAQEDERRRIARELHDDIGQRLALLAVMTTKLCHGFTPQMENERALAKSLIGDVQNLNSDIHTLSHQLHSTALQHMGLEVALKGLCTTIARQHQIVIDFRSNGITGLHRDIDLCLFRVAQEALNNAVRHGAAKQIEVSLSKSAQLLSMKVRDEGIGFDPVRVSNGLGLISMRERLRFVGGDVIVRSAAGSGTEITAEVPLRESA